MIGRIQTLLMLGITRLLLHSDDVPAAARTALSNALATDATARADSLIAAARILHRDIGLDCEDALVLVGLDDSCGCNEPTAD